MSMPSSRGGRRDGPASDQMPVPLGEPDSSSSVAMMLSTVLASLLVDESPTGCESLGNVVGTRSSMYTSGWPDPPGPRRLLDHSPRSARSRGDRTPLLPRAAPSQDREELLTALPRPFVVKRAGEVDSRRPLEAPSPVDTGWSSLSGEGSSWVQGAFAFLA